MTDKSIQNGLEQDARLVRERMPMSLTKAKAKQVAGSLRSFIKERGFSQAKVARMLGISPAVINQFLAGKYKGDLKSLINKVVNLINSVTRREQRVRNKTYIETTVAKKIATLIIQTGAFSNDQEGKIGIVIGDAGHGKSLCLRQYAEANQNTIYVELCDSMHSTRIFSEIAKKLDLDSSGSLDSVCMRLIDNLQNRHITIMIDEASSLTVKQLSQLRTVIVVKARCPLILSGNSHLLHTISQPTTRRGFESLDQFRSRLVCVLNLDKLASGNLEGDGLYSREDIRKLYEFGGIKLTGDGVSILRNIARTPQSGRLRTCSHIIEALHLTPVVEKLGKIDAALIIKAIEQLDLPVNPYLPVVVPESADTSQKLPVAKAG